MAVTSCRVPVLATASALILAAPAAAQPATPTAARVWAEAPTYADVAASYPAKARAADRGGQAVIDCQFSSGGRLGRCLTVSESPHGEGFADAARKLAGKFRAASDDAQRVGATAESIELAVAFDPAMLRQDKPVIGRPMWAALPTAADVDAAFAGTPRNLGPVRVVLDCTVEQGGAMGGCAVESEDPPGRGFGQAALALAAKTRVETWTNQGLPVVGGRVRIPIRFETGAPAAG